jgi:Na+/proline symporter
MRFLWKYVPLMGIAWFMAILWRRANRWGAIASFVAALAAAAVAQWVLKWEGDAGLPWTITLYLACGIGAGVIVSLLTRAESTERTEQFFLLLKTPIGQEQVLRDAGFRELPGKDTWELPVDVKPELRAFPVIPAGVPDERLSVDYNSGAATAVAVAPNEVMTTAPRITVEEALARIDNHAARRQSIAGFITMIAVIIVMLTGMIILANWLRP